MPENGYVNGYYVGKPLGKPTQDKLVPEGITGKEVPENTKRYGTVTQDILVDNADYNFNPADPDAPEEEGGTQ